MKNLMDQSDLSASYIDISPIIAKSSPQEVPADQDTTKRTWSLLNNLSTFSDQAPS